MKVEIESNIKFYFVANVKVAKAGNTSLQVKYPKVT